MIHPVNTEEHPMTFLEWCSSTFKSLLGDFLTDGELLVFVTKEKTNLQGLLIKEPGLKRFPLHAVKKYLKGRQHCWWTAFASQFYIKKFGNSAWRLFFVIWEKRFQCGKGGGGIIFICVSSGFSLPSIFFQHERILNAVDFLDHHITHRGYE